MIWIQLVILLRLQSLKDTHDFAKSLVSQISDSKLLILKGELGAGKTTLVQFLAKELGSDAIVTSPSYTLIHEYPSPKGLIVHIDAYRLASPDELFELGLEDYLERASLTVVEWGEDLLEYFPEAVLVEINFEDDVRIVEVKKQQ